MALDKYWVGGDGNTNDSAHWAATSGGAGGAGVPASSNEIVVDANSGTGTMIVNANLACRSFRSAASAITLQKNSSIALNIGDATRPTGDVALDFSGLVNYTKQNSVAATINFISEVPNTVTFQQINTGGFSLGSISMYGSANPGYILVGNHLVMTGYFGMSSGFSGASFASNGFNVTARRYTFGFGAVIGGNTGTWSITENAAATVWSMGNSGFTVYLAENSTIEMGATSTGTRVFNGGNKTYNLVRFINSGSTGTITIGDSNTFDRLQFQDASNARTLRLTAGTAQTINNYTPGDIQGGSGRLISIDTTTGGSPATLNSLKPFDSDYLSVKDITAGHNTPFYAGANSSNVSGNTNWIFTARPKSGMFAGF